MVPKNNELTFLNTKIPQLEPNCLHAKISKYRPNLKPMVPRAHLSSDLSYTKFGNSWSQGPMGLPILRKPRKSYTFFFKFKVLFGAFGRPIIGKYVPTVPQTSLLGSLSEALGPLRSH